MDCRFAFGELILTNQRFGKITGVGKESLLTLVGTPKAFPFRGRWLAEGQTDEDGVRVTHSIWNGRHEWRPYGCFARIFPYSLLPTP